MDLAEIGVFRKVFIKGWGAARGDFQWILRALIEVSQGHFEQSLAISNDIANRAITPSHRFVICYSVTVNIFPVTPQRPCQNKIEVKTGLRTRWRLEMTVENIYYFFSRWHVGSHPEPTNGYEWESGSMFGSGYTWFLDPGWKPTKIQGSDDQKITADKKFKFFFFKNCNLLIPRPPRARSESNYASGSGSANLI